MSSQRAKRTGGGERGEGKPIVGLTMGDPGGIGAEVIVAASTSRSPITTIRACSISSG